MRRTKAQKGITLIALIITIIVLLILAVVAIGAVQNDGIINHAKNAREEYRKAQVNENKTLQGYLDKLNENGGKEENTHKEELLVNIVKPGDYVKHIPDTATTNSILEELETYSGSNENTTSTLTQENLNWRVLDVVDGKVRLISEKPTTSKIKLYGTTGYNNAVSLLDKTCSALYGNFKYAEKVQNLKIEDIQKYTDTDLSRRKQYFADEFYDIIYFELFINDGLYDNYYLSDESYVESPDWAVWGCRSVRDLYISYVSLYEEGEDAGEYTASCGLRPVVTLNSNVLVKSGDGKSSESAYEIGIE